MLNIEKLRDLRRLHNVSQIELGKELGVTKNYISMVENRHEKLTKQFHDRYINAVYKISMRKQNESIFNELENVKEVVQSVINE